MEMYVWYDIRNLHPIEAMGESNLLWPVRMVFHGELNYLKGISFPSENTSSNFTSSRVELISPVEFNKISKKIFSCQQNSSLIVYALCHCLKRKEKKVMFVIRYHSYKGF